ncbi:MAG TPA: hypothetical protein VEG25_00105 [Burkholderiales bacterium]|nr:hypothetical protein [Burkholderiales bacterium]
MDNRIWPTALCAVLLLSTQPASANSPILSFQVQDPRPFGYVIGDTIERTIELEALKPFQLDTGKLPKTGRAGTWVALQTVKLATSSHLHSIRYRLALTYQLINSPEAVKHLTLPKVNLELMSGDKAIVQQVPEFTFSAGPLTPPHTPAAEGMYLMRPDQAPPLISQRMHRVWFFSFLAILILALLYMAYLRFGLPWGGPRPFAWAYRDVRRLAKQADGDEAFRLALRRVHRAFDQTAGRPLFQGELGVFFVEHPRFARMRSTSERFFEISQNEFFGTGAGERPMQWLLTFCRDWRAAEAG